MRYTIEDRTINEAAYIIETRATVRGAAAHFLVSKSTVHHDLIHRLPKMNRSLYLDVREVLDENLEDRHNRGGEATKRKYNAMARKPRR